LALTLCRRTKALFSEAENYKELVTKSTKNETFKTPQKEVITPIILPPFDLGM
jgi:hypothetical protein